MKRNRVRELHAPIRPVVRQDVLLEWRPYGNPYATSRRPGGGSGAGGSKAAKAAEVSPEKLHLTKIVEEAKVAVVGGKLSKEDGKLLQGWVDTRWKQLNEYRDGKISAIPPHTTPAPPSD